MIYIYLFPKSPGNVSRNIGGQKIEVVQTASSALARGILNLYINVFLTMWQLVGPLRAPDIQPRFFKSVIGFYCYIVLALSLWTEGGLGFTID